MPPKSPLADGEKEVLRTWIASGAGWGTDPIDAFQTTTARRAGRDWWSLQPLKRHAPPSVRKGDWVRTPIDRFILKELEHNGHLTGARGGSPHAHSPRVLRSDRAAAGAGSDRRICT